LVDTVLVKAEPLDGSAVVVLMALNIVTLDVLGLNLNKKKERHMMKLQTIKKL
jgi:hypothetical protein